MNNMDPFAPVAQQKQQQQPQPTSSQPSNVNNINAAPTQPQPQPQQPVQQTQQPINAATNNAPPPSTSTPNTSTNTTSTDKNQIHFLPLYDAFLDLPHPGASNTSNVNFKRLIIAPPKDVLKLSMNVGKELATEKGLKNVAAFCFPEFYMDNNKPVGKLFEFYCEGLKLN